MHRLFAALFVSMLLIVPAATQWVHRVPPSVVERRRRLSWAELLQRVFHIGTLECPHCGARRKLIALITCLSAVA